VAALERSQATVRDQAEAIGMLRAEVATPKASQAQQGANPGPEAPKRTT
jgi:hypothetical protein